jgi:hypothetical protein
LNQICRIHTHNIEPVCAPREICVYCRSDGRVCIDDEGNGSSFYNELEYYMCGIFGFQGYNPSGEIDPYMKSNVAAPLFGVEPGSSVHVDYILNRRGE